ncbi:MAG: hypothetical protein H0W62_01035 [Chitinophagales bacterium]|nr:hypothetical protein [Chitinophagales bacterium]
MYNAGKLIYVGHAGTGFNDKSLKELFEKMKPLTTERSPLTTRVSSNGPVTWESLY